MHRRLCILIPVFNNQSGLSLTLDSLQKATIDFDVLVVDDGSNVPVRAPAMLGGKRQVEVRRDLANRGISGALNIGLSEILPKGYRYVGRLDAGDTANPQRFEKQVSFLESNPDYGLVGSYIEFCDADRGTLFHFQPPTGHDEIKKRMHVENCLIHSGVTIRASAIEDVGLYMDCSSAAEDYELFWRVMQKYRVSNIPEVLTTCDMNPRGISVRRRRRQQIERLKCQLKHFDRHVRSSYFGVIRTLAALATPQQLVIRAKR